jgi:hypothetical protein
MKSVDVSGRDTVPLNDGLRGVAGHDAAADGLSG